MDAPLPEVPEAAPDACPRCGCTDENERTVLGVTPAGSLLRCCGCFEEWIVPDAAAREVAAQRSAQVAQRHGEAVHERIVGPLPTGPVTRLRHDAMVAAMAGAAQHSMGTVESVVLWLRASGFEIVAAQPVRCVCPRAPHEHGETLRSPICKIHGDADELVA